MACNSGLLLNTFSSVTKYVNVDLCHVLYASSTKNTILDLQFNLNKSNMSVVVSVREDQTCVYLVSLLLRLLGQAMMEIT